MGYTLRYILLVAALLGAGVEAADSTLAPVVKMLESGGEVRIVCIGDSITGVYFHTGTRKAWPELLGDGLSSLYPKASIKVTNAGIGGNTTPLMLIRTDKDVLSVKPHLVICMIGMNDKNLGLEKSIAQFEEFAQKIKAAKVPLLCATQNIVADQKPPFTDERSAVCDKLGIPVADCFEAFRSLKARDAAQFAFSMSDAIHPNFLGHRLFAQTIIKTLTGKDVAASALPCTNPSTPLLLKKFQEGKEVKISTIGVDEKVLSDAIASIHKGAKLAITPRNAGATIEEFAGKDKAFWQAAAAEDLIVVAPPVETKLADTIYYFHLNRIRNGLCAYDKASQHREVLWLLPSVLSPSLSDADKKREALIKTIADSMDIGTISRADGDKRSPAEVIAAWLKQQVPTK
jgi:acyl-CoA thioesterase-1